MPTTITSAAVVSMFGDYYLNTGKNENNIHDTLRESFVDPSDFLVIDTEETRLRESNVTYAEVLQSFQTAYTPKGGVTFSPKEIPLFNVKVDQSFYPDQLKNQWLAFMTSEKTDRTTWPFVRWFIEKYMLGQIAADLTKNLYGAVYVPPVAGTAGAASASFDGLKKIINAGITSGGITTIATGTPNATASTFATQIETFCKGIPELYWDKAMDIKTSRALALRYKEGRRTKYNSNYQQAVDASAVQDFESIGVSGRASLAGVNKIWTTVPGNGIMAFKGGSNQNIVEIEKVDRQVKVYTDFWIGMGFITDSLVYTNDQDLV